MDKQVEDAVKSQLKPRKLNNPISSELPPVNASQDKNQNYLSSLPDNFNAVKELNIFYIFVGLSAIIVICFVLQAMRVKSSKASRLRRYGVATGSGDVEMMPLDNEDDDEDATIFDITDHSASKP